LYIFAAIKLHFPEKEQRYFEEQELTILSNQK